MTGMHWFITRNDDAISSSQLCGFLTDLVTFCNNWFIASCIFYNVILVEIIFCNSDLSCMIRRHRSLVENENICRSGDLF